MLERLLADFAGGAIFGSDPLLPPELAREFALHVVTPDNVSAEWRAGECHLVVTNIHKLFDTDDAKTGAKQARATRYADILREATRADWNYLSLVNDGSIGRQDVGWWRAQGRTRFRDLVRHIANAATGGGLL